MKCKHENADHLIPGEWFEPWSGGGVCVAVEQFRCLDCEAWLSFGPANDTAAVLIEIRAAELTALWQPIDGVMGIAEPDERNGWSGWPYRQPRNIGERVGFLAAQILNHARDLGDVNWAGQHMADHDVEPTHGADQ